MKSQNVILPIATKDGEFLAHYSRRGLAGLDFPGRGDASGPSPELNAAVSPQIRAWHRITESALIKLLAGAKQVKLPPLDLMGTEFQKSVWGAMLKIASGKTKSYGEIAREIGKPAAVRAVGGACGANPVPVLVPCHRILAANKKIGGFGGGLDWKRKLLSREGVVLE